MKFSNSFSDFTNSIQWQKIGMCYLIAAFLYLSFILPPLNAIWHWIDEAGFLFLNGLVCTSGEMLNKAFAYSNTRAYDKVSALAILIVLALFVVFSKTRDFFTRAGIASFISLFMLVGVNARRETGLMEYGRLSPSLERDFCNLRDLFVDMAPKVSSNSAFPSDHFISCMFFVAMIWVLGNRKWGLLSLALTPFFIFPRLISGAHWLTDGLVGATVFSLAVLSLILFTPLAEKSVQSIGCFYKAIFDFVMKGLKLWR